MSRIPLLTTGAAGFSRLSPRRLGIGIDCSVFFIFSELAFNEGLGEFLERKDIKLPASPKNFRPGLKELVLAIAFSREIINQGA